MPNLNALPGFGKSDPLKRGASAYLSAFVKPYGIQGVRSVRLRLSSKGRELPFTAIRDRVVLHHPEQTMPTATVQDGSTLEISGACVPDWYLLPGLKCMIEVHNTAGKATWVEWVPKWSEQIAPEK